MRRLLPVFIIICSISASTMVAQEVDITKYRTIDGTHNNVENTAWGSAGENLQFLIPPSYPDGMSAPVGMERPNPRHLSNDIFSQNGLINDPLALSDYCWVWGQFLDHDIGLTPDGEEFFPISIPAGDPWFDPMESGQVIIPTLRNRFDPNTGTSPDNPRSFPNLITAYIDGSAVYGSDQERADWLRSFEGGKLKVSAHNMLPFNTTTGEYDDPVDHSAPEMDDAVGIHEKLFVAGDVRANENPLLLSFHTLFVREHNRVVEEAAQKNPEWDDEELYQYGRKMVSGYIQSIVYNEYLPAMGVHLDEYSGYNPNVNPQLFNLFTGAAFRLGHTLLNGVLMRMNDDGTEYEAGHLTLRESFFNPLLVMEEGNLDPFLKGMGVQMQQELDARVIDDVRNFLFGPPGAGGMDLAAINIIRGRERGLPDLNTVRQALGLRKHSIFREVNIGNIGVTYQLLRNYGNVNNIDLWVGLLSEQPMPGALFGETLMEIMKIQFTALRDGDRFYYLNDPVLTSEEKEEITRTSFHDLIMRNTGITLMQDNVFKALPHAEICNNMTVEVLGNVRTEDGAPVSRVGINLAAGNNSFLTLTTGLNGTFDFTSVPGCEAKSISLEKNDDHSNGLSTLDLILVQKHILNRERLDSPYKILAADVDNSGTVSTIDLIKMRKVILSIDLTLNDQWSWEFIPEEFQFTDPDNPFADVVPTSFDLEAGASDYRNNYVAIKLGDVNNSAVATEGTPAGSIILGRSAKTVSFELEDMTVREGNTYRISFSAKDFKDISGYQFGLRFDPSQLEILDVQAETLDNLSEGNFAILNQEGLITTSWNNAAGATETLEDAAAIFSLEILAKEDAQLSELISLDNSTINSEAYTDDLRTTPVALAFTEGGNALLGSFELYQNQPNPFNNTTNIPFFVPEGDQVSLVIFDASGKLIYQQNQRFAAGYNEWIVRSNDVPGTGVYYYRVASKNGAATRKMIVTN